LSLAYEKVTRLISRSLGLDPRELSAAFKPAGRDDLAPLLAFRQAYLGNSIAWDDAQYLIWRYDFSPFDVTKAADTETTNRYWVLKLNDEICGAIGFDQVNLVINGKVSPAKNPLDLLVKSELDGLGLGVWMSLHLQQRYPLMFAMGATRRSHSIVKKLFHPMPDIGAWKILLDTETYIQRHIHNPFFSRLFARCVNRGLRLVRFWQQPSSNTSVTVTPLERFSTAPDEVAKLEHGINSPSVIFRQRSGEFLNWRFIDNPRRQYQTLVAHTDQRLSGYVVYRIQEQKLHIADLFFATNDANTAYALLKQLLVIAHQQKLSMILFIALAPSYSTYLQNMGFSWRDDGHLFSVFTADEALQALIYDEQNWLATEIDTHNEGY
jgi:hypothetical protein